MTTTDLGASEFRSTVLAALRRFWNGREVILLSDDFDHRATVLVDEVRACGGRVTAVVARTAPGPGAPAIPRVWSCARDGASVPSRPEFEALLTDPPADLSSWLDRADPERQWIALGTPRTGVATFCGRAVHGWRRARWAAVEDKTTIDELWARAGVTSPRHVVVTLSEQDVPSRLDAVAGSAGVVVAADSTRGYVGDSLGLRWIPDVRRWVGAVSELADRAERMRIARFEDGVPCSVLGMALPDGVAVFGPVEIVTLGDRSNGRLLFCGSGTHWRPEATAVEEIRSAAASAGAVLVRDTGYRGLFSVDGLLTADGFTATELNPRHASGLGLRAAWPEFPVYLFNRAVQEQVDGLPGIAAADLESLVRNAVHAAPSWSLSVPAPAVDERDGPGSVRDRGTTIRFTRHGTKVALTGIEPPAADGRAGPACAALAAYWGTPGMSAFPLSEKSFDPTQPSVNPGTRGG